MQQVHTTHWLKVQSVHGPSPFPGAPKLPSCPGFQQHHFFTRRCCCHSWGPAHTASSSGCFPTAQGCVWAGPWALAAKGCLHVLTYPQRTDFQVLHMPIFLHDSFSWVSSREGNTYNFHVYSALPLTSNYVYGYLNNCIILCVFQVQHFPIGHY